MTKTIQEKKHGHTAIPYRAFTNPYKTVVIEDERAKFVIAVLESTNLELNEANAEFIVSSCNSYYKMVSLLKQCLTEDISDDTRYKIKELLKENKEI